MNRRHGFKRKMLGAAAAAFSVAVGALSVPSAANAADLDQGATLSSSVQYYQDLNEYYQSGGGTDAQRGAWGQHQAAIWSFIEDARTFEANCTAHLGGLSKAETTLTKVGIREMKRHAEECTEEVRSQPLAINGMLNKLNPGGQ